MTNPCQRRIVLMEECFWLAARILSNAESMHGAADDRRSEAVGPCQLGELGAMITVRCPHDFDGVMLKAGGLWEPGRKRWLIER
jgi:hypothetical protein